MRSLGPSPLLPLMISCIYVCKSFVARMRQGSLSILVMWRKLAHINKGVLLQQRHPIFSALLEPTLEKS